VVDDETLAEAAITEIAHPSLGVTEQILSVNRVIPIPMALDRTTDNLAVFVFFAVESEPYHVWVRLNAERRVVEFAGVEPSSEVAIIISSDSVPVEAITEWAGLTPTVSMHRGDVKRLGRGLYRTNRWVFEPWRGYVEFLEVKLARATAVLTELSTRGPAPALTHIEVAVSSRQWSAWPAGFHLSAELVTAAARVRASIDIDQYLTGPELTS
jgi:hypothetical protein